MPPNVIATGAPPPSRSAMLGNALGEGAGVGLGAAVAEYLNSRRLGKQLNPMREALLASMPYEGPMASMQSQQAASMLTPQQRMIQAAAQDPRSFAQLAGSPAGALELGGAMQGQPRTRDIVVRPGDELNERLGLGLKGAETAVVELSYDGMDRQQPGFNIKNFRSTTDNTDAPAGGSPGSSGVADIMFMNSVRADNGIAPMTPEETESYLKERQMTGSAQQNYRRYTAQEEAAGRAPMSFEAWAPSFGAAQGMGAISAEVVAKSLGEDREAAVKAVQRVNSINTGYQLLDKGVMTGTAAGPRVQMAKLFATLTGQQYDGDTTTAATEAFLANSGRLVGQVITQFGAGTGLSDADREFAKLIAGGNITMTDQALRMTLEILARGSLGEINEFNQRLGSLQGHFQVLGMMYQPLSAGEQIYSRLSPLVRAPEDMPETEKLQFYLNQRPTFAATPTNAQLPPTAGGAPQPAAQRPPPNASVDQLLQFYNRPPQ